MAPKNKLLLLLSFSLVLTAALSSCKSNKENNFDASEISTVKTLPENHKQFIANFYPDAVEANQNIMRKRAMLIDLRDDYRHVVHKKRKLKTLNKLAADYKMGDNYFTDSISKSEYKQKIDSLLHRVDYIPEKLIMAQAIIESGWGKSKFAREINNYFGIHCYTAGCGRYPDNVENPKFMVKSFSTRGACIEEYVWLLNTGYAYHDLRARRIELREDNKYPNAKLLAEGLTRYSEKGDEYISLIKSIINNYLPKDLEAFTKYYNAGEPELSPES